MKRTVDEIRLCELERPAPVVFKQVTVWEVEEPIVVVEVPPWLRLRIKVSQFGFDVWVTLQQFWNYRVKEVYHGLRQKLIFSRVKTFLRKLWTRVTSFDRCSNRVKSLKAFRVRNHVSGPWDKHS